MLDNQDEQARNPLALDQVKEYLSLVNEHYEEILDALEGAASKSCPAFNELPELRATFRSVGYKFRRLKAQTQELRDRFKDTEEIELTGDLLELQHRFDILQKKVTSHVDRYSFRLGQLEREAARSRQSKVTQARKQPPLNAQFLLYLFLERGGREEAVGDALEEYSMYIKRVGKVRADILFYQEVGRCAWPFIKRVVAKVGGLIVIGQWLRKLTN